MSWTPTHVQVTVHRARNLLPKGKAGTNDAYVTIQLGKEKYQTSVKERCDNPEWHEECDLQIPDMSGSVILNIYHRSFLGLDDFLGHVSVPLNQFQIYERPRSRWYSLKSKPGKKDEKYRGEIEVKVTFIVQSKSDSQSSLRIPRAGSIKNLAATVGEKLKLPTRSNSFRSDKSSSSSGTEKNPLTGSVEAISGKSPGHKQKTLSLEDYYKPPAPKQEQPEQEKEQSTTAAETECNTEEPLEGEPVDTGEIIISYPPTPDLNRRSSKSPPPPKPPRNRPQKPERPPRPMRNSVTDSDSPREPIKRGLIDEVLTRSQSHKSVEGSMHVHRQHAHSSRHGFGEGERQTETEGEQMGENLERMNEENLEIRGLADGDEASVASVASDLSGTKESPLDGASDADSVSSNGGDPIPVHRMMRVGHVNHVGHVMGHVDDDVLIRNLHNECGLERRWSVIGPESEDFDRLQRHRQPVYRAPRLKRAQSDADARFVDRRRPVSMIEGSTETPLLSDTRELARSLGKLNEDDLRWIGSDCRGSHERISRAGSGSLVPESIPEEGGDAGGVGKERGDGEKRHTERQERIRKLRDRDSNRRHTLQGERELPAVATYDLHKGVGESISRGEKENELPREILDEYKHLSREDLIRMVHTQRQQIYRKDLSIKDLEGYIDNLLVKVMESSPRILQNPYATPKYLPSTISITPSTNIIIQTHGNPVTHSNNHSNNKTNNKYKAKHHSNPFKKIQAALK